MKLNNLKTKKSVLGHYVLMLFFSIFCTVVTVHAQNSEITGVVTGVDDGMPIPGITVLKVGTNTGAVTNFDGVYSIKAKVGDVLQFSYLGMETQSKTVTEPTLNVAMQSDLENLDEVVVIGYGSVKKKEVTGAVSSLKAEDIENIVTSDLGSAMQGQVAGVNIIASSGEPGSPSEIIIRGITTVSGDNTPLYVVDGLIQEGDPGISPNEVESIDILKDAASTAIYGTRGAAGVILITTKQGREGSLSVSVNSSFGLQTLSREPTRLMNANQQTYFELANLRNGSNLGLGDDQLDIIGVAGPLKLQYDTNLYNYIVLDNRQSQNHSVNISGGTKDITYSVTTGLFKQDGILVNSDFERFNIRANTTYKHDKWDIRASVSVINEDRLLSTAPVNQIIRYQPNRPDLQALEPDEVIVTLGGLNGTITGWVLESFENENRRADNKVQTNLNVNYNFTENLKVSLRYGVSTANRYSHSFNPFREVIDVNGDSRSPAESSGVSNGALRSLNKSFDAYATYKFNLLENHDFTFTAGVTSENYFTEQFKAERSQLVDNSLKVLRATEGIADVDSGLDSRHRIKGMIGRIQYGYKGKYLFSSSVRRDASSRFAPENRVGIFPSAAFAWNVSDEAFWSPMKKVINSFKFRATYGEVGNERFSDYSYQATISDKIDYVFGRTGSDISIGGGTQTGFANEVVKWETSIQKNLGIDLGFFKNRLTFAFEYYVKDNEDMLFPIPVTPSGGGGGGSTVILNVGNMTNKGLELTAGYRPRIKGLNLRMTGTFSTNKNKVTQINGLGGFAYITKGALETQVTTLAEGYEAGAFFLYPTDGVVNNQEELDAYKLIEPAAKLGDLIYKDTDNSGDISEADRVYSGGGLPKYQIGYNLNAGYKGFDLSMNWYAALGHKILNGSKLTAFEFGRHEDLVYQWTEANPTSNIPSYRGKDHNNHQGYTDVWLEDGDYLRLKQVTLGYSLSKSVLEKLGGVSKLRFYITTQNPLIFTKYTGYDPEVGGNLARRGLDRNAYPKTVQYLAGLQLNF